MSYSQYRLAATITTFKTSPVTGIHRILKSLELTMNNFMFPVEYSILISNFLNLLVAYADVIDMDEGKRILCVLQMLKNSPLWNTNWPRVEVVQAVYHYGPEPWNISYARTQPKLKFSKQPIRWNHFYQHRLKRIKH